MIQVEALRKHFGDLVAVDDVSFTAEPGEIFGLLGPNGAGKSTTISCISGLLRPDGGEVRLLGKPVKAARQELGIVPQEIALYESLSATDNLSYWGAAYGLRGTALKERVKETLDAVGLGDRADEPVENFSGGMQRRLNFACGIAHRPKVLLLDEPTVGVDPQSRVHLLEQVRAQAAAGTCVLYTTHYMEEAQDLCDRLGIIDGGKLIAQGTLSELRSMMKEQDLLRLSGTFDADAARAAIEMLPEAELVAVDPHSLVVSANHASQLLPQLFQALGAAGADIRETTLTQSSLESLFIKLTGKELRE